MVIDQPTTTYRITQGLLGMRPGPGPAGASSTGGDLPAGQQDKELPRLEVASRDRGRGDPLLARRQRQAGWSRARRARPPRAPGRARRRADPAPARGRSSAGRLTGTIKRANQRDLRLRRQRGTARAYACTSGPSIGTRVTGTRRRWMAAWGVRICPREPAVWCRAVLGVATQTASCSLSEYRRGSEDRVCKRRDALCAKHTLSAWAAEDATGATIVRLRSVPTIFWLLCYRIQFRTDPLRKIVFQPTCSPGWVGKLLR